MVAADVSGLYRELEDSGAPVWLMGGWGVDALLGRQTRPHHDLDLLVEVSDLERLRTRLEALGFEPQYLWDDECRWVHDDAWESTAALPTAFVYRAVDGREVDVHVIRHAIDGSVEMLWNVPYVFTAEGLQGTGTVDGVHVRCLSRELQLAAHTGYHLPPHHLRDRELLGGAVLDDGPT
jgi:lincosamide nucleotidyltransferase A/C/D/E